MINLELCSADELLAELITRYTAIVIVGVHREHLDDLTQVVMGPAYMCIGLVKQIDRELAAAKPEIEE